MTPFEKFKKHAETVLFWIEDEKPRVRRFGCENCNYRRYHCDSDFGVATQSYQVCCCLPCWYTPIAKLDSCPKEDYPNAGKLSSIIKVNQEVQLKQ